MRFEDKDRRLIEALRAGDPASGQKLDAETVTSMRRRMRQELGRPQRRPLSGAILWGAASAAVVLAVLLILRHQGGPARVPAGTAGADRATMAGKGHERTVREIHFVTKNGTRVIWTLDSDFDI